jgi:tRNA-dihydrouridine synthase B
LKKLQIGNAVITNPILLAPMAGVTDLSFRIICKEMGCGLAYTEMVSAKGIYYENDRTNYILHISELEKPTAVQIFGSDPKIMSVIAERISKMDGVLLIDINMGCPAPKIVKNGEGSALMKTPKLAGDIVKAVSSSSEVPVTVKMRTGWDENSINVLEIAEVCEKNGAAAITVHGRTRKQMYSGKADWDIIKAVKRNSSVPVIGNGDIFKAEDVKSMFEYTNCDGVMIARGAQGNPWIFKSALQYLNLEDSQKNDKQTSKLIYEPTWEEKIDMAIRHMNMIIEHKGEYVGIRESRKNTACYLKGLKNSSGVKEMINHEENREKVVEILTLYQKQLKFYQND